MSAETDQSAQPQGRPLTARGGGAELRALEGKERLLGQGALGELLSSLRVILPLSRRRFDTMLGKGLDAAREQGAGFYVGGMAARRALSRELIVHVDPRRIEHRLQHRVGVGDRIHRIRDRFLGAGDWTPLLTPVRASSTYRDVAEVVKANLDYQETRAYRNALERAKSGKPVNRNFVALDSEAKVDSYFGRTAELCRSIREQGIRARADLGGEGLGYRLPGVRLPWVELAEADIGLAIGAEGELYRFGPGKHRTAAAQALGLESMPVEVRVVHVDWLERQMMERGRGPVEALLAGIAVLGSS